MEALKSWGTAVCLAALAAGIAGIVAPTGKLEKAFKFAVSLFFLCCLLVPLFNLNKVSLGGIRLGAPTSSAANAALEDTLSSQAEGMAESNVEKLVENCCSDSGVKPLDVDIGVTADGTGGLTVTSVEITLRKADMPKQSRIKDTVQNRLGLAVKIKEGEN